MPTSKQDLIEAGQEAVDALIAAVEGHLNGEDRDVEMAVLLGTIGTIKEEAEKLSAKHSRKIS